MASYTLSSPQVAATRRAASVGVGAPYVFFDEAVIRRAARRHGPGPIAWLALRYASAAARLRIVQKIHFRQANNAGACAAYEAMDPVDFATINGRQAWANWRTIPRNLSGRLTGRPVRVLDLCCGSGDSTAVLAHFCPSGSRILGIEFNPRFVAIAQRRHFRDRFGSPASVAFRSQSVLEPFRDEDGGLLPAHSVDLVNASGAIGCHFDTAATERVAVECSRVLRSGGHALMDVGREGTSARELLDVFIPRGFVLVGQARSCALDRCRQLCLLKTA